ncbi:iron ABC transporter permease [Paenibacillus sp. YYML68]|uniref:ABC transporter permease n=1 Tax=Paenibacillus sp. YYML68 TaxID=2909250 RepID=UPI0024933EEF|nr:iron ABC transporter permease [Paenibacillus sp. YYML68]
MGMKPELNQSSYGKERRADEPGFLSFSYLSGRRLLGWLGLLLVLVLFLLPIVKLVLLSLQSDAGLPLSLRAYMEVLEQPRTWKTLQETLVVVAGATSMAVVLGVLAAWMMAYTDVRAKKALHLAILLSFILPSYVLTLSWSSFMGSQGPVAALLQLLSAGAKPWSMYSLGGIIFVMGLHHFPLVYLLTVDALRRIPRDLEWAARASGAGRLGTLRLVTLPMAMPGITAGGLLAFLASLDNFGIPAFLGIPANISVLSTLIYEEIIGFGPSAFARGAALSVLLGSIAIAGALVQRLLSRRAKAAETLVPDDRPRLVLGVWRRPVELAVWGFLLLIAVVPLFSMVAISLKKAYGLPFGFENMTLSNYTYILFENPKVSKAIANSLKLSLYAMLICLAAGTWLAYLRVRRPGRLVKTAEGLIAIPYALPGIVFGLSMILAWMEPIPGWNPGLYGTSGILLLAYVCRFLVLQARASATAFLQIDPSVEEAARASGAGMWTTWRVILVPLLLQGLLSGAFLVFLTALTELTVSALLYAAGTQTIGVTVFGFEQAGDTMYSTALSCLIVLLTAAGMGGTLALQHWSNRRGVRA